MSVLDIQEPDQLGICRITFTRPNQANALNAELVEALIAAFSDAASNGTRVLVLRGEGRNFCAGFELSNFEAETDASLALRLIRIEQMLQALVSAPFLSVACVHGAAFGAGADIVAACDQRFALEAARFRFPGYRFGVALGTRRLAAITGASVAQDMLVSGRIILAEEALTHRLLMRMLDVQATTAEIDRLAENLAVLDPVAAVTLVTNARESAINLDTDLALLVRSVARPGLKARLQAYAESARKS